MTNLKKKNQLNSVKDWTLMLGHIAGLVDERQALMYEELADIISDMDTKTVHAFGNAVRENEVIEDYYLFALNCGSYNTRLVRAKHVAIKYGLPARLIEIAIAVTQNC